MPLRTPTGFRDLPPEMRAEIAQDLITDDPYETFENFNRFIRSDQTIRIAVLENPQLRKTYRGLQGVIADAKRLSRSLDDLSRVGTQTDPENSQANSALSQVGGNSRQPPEADYSHMDSVVIAAHGSILGLLPPDRRRILVNAAIEKEDDNERGMAVNGLMTGSKYMHPDDRADCLTAFIALNDPYKGGVAFDTVGAQLEHQSPRRRSIVVKNVLGMDLKDVKAISISGLAPGFEHLKTKEVESLVGVIIDPQRQGAIGDWAYLAMKGLGPGLKYVQTMQVTGVFDVLTKPDHPNAPPHSWQRAIGIGGVGAGLNCFTSDQRKALFNIVAKDTHDLSLTESRDIATAIAGWGQGLGHLESQQRSEIFRIVTDPTHPKALTDSDQLDAITGLAQGLKHLEPRQRTKLVEIVCGPQLPPELDGPKASAIEELLAEGKYLTKDERSALFSTARALEESDRTVAIGGMWRGMGDLEKGEYGSLVAATEGLSDRPVTQVVDHGAFQEEWQEPSCRLRAMSAQARGIGGLTSDIIAGDKNIALMMEKPHQIGNRGLAERSRSDSMVLGS